MIEFFKSEDFSYPAEDVVLRSSRAALIANQKLNEALGRKVYIDDSFGEVEEYWCTIKDDPDICSENIHEAYIFNVQPVKECTEHEPDDLDFNVQVNCKNCGKKLKATFEVIDD